MSRSVFVVSIMAACSLLATACDPPPPTEDHLIAQATEIHGRLLTIDTHDDIPPNFATDEVDPGAAGGRQVTLPQMRDGGLDVAFFIVYVGQTERTEENYAKAKEDALVKFAAIHRMADTLYPAQIELAYSTADVTRIHESGKLVAAIGIENGYAIGKDLSLLERYYELGARYITLAHGGHNDIADSSTPRDHLDDGPEEHGGISAFGEEVIAEMNRLGIMVDVSHISKNAMLDAARLSRAPVIASHSSVRALADHPRNMDDEQLLALKANGGVMQTVAFDGYVKVPPPEKVAARSQLREDLGLPPRGFSTLTPEQREEFIQGLAKIDEQWPGATVSDFVDHIDYAVDLIGIDHVGISSDFDGGGGVEGWDNAAETLNVTIELVRRGYTEDEIAKLWSGNVLRVWRAVEQVAAEM